MTTPSFPSLCTFAVGVNRTCVPSNTNNATFTAFVAVPALPGGITVGADGTLFGAAATAAVERVHLITLTARTGSVTLAVTLEVLTGPRSLHLLSLTCVDKTEYCSPLVHNALLSLCASHSCVAVPRQRSRRGLLSLCGCSADESVIRLHPRHAPCWK